MAANADADRFLAIYLNDHLAGATLGVELEFLSGMVGGKLQLWNALEQSYGETLESFDFHDLAARADSQGQRLEDLHLAATQRALPAATSSTQGIP